jgi:SRSO17 transposase
MVESSDVPKHGEYSVGVARQWCGHVGQVDHGQAGGVAAYASRTGYTLLDRRLYRPEEWCEVAHRERWGTCGIPAETLCKTTQALALEMVQAIVTEGGLWLRGLTCDEALGRDGAFLDGIVALGRWYVADVPHDTQIWLPPPQPRQCRPARAGADGPARPVWSPENLRRSGTISSRRLSLWTSGLPP